MGAGSAYSSISPSDIGQKRRGPVLAFISVMDTEISPNRARILALQKRSFDLTCAVVSSYPKRAFLDDASRIIWRQLVRAISSSTLNLEEADAASSDVDFLAKMRIALRESKEARVAIRIIVNCKLAGNEAVAQYEDEANQMAKIFGKIIVNKRAGMNRRRPDF